MVISLKTTSGGASSIGYALTKNRNIQQADKMLNKQNENVIFVRADHLKTDNILDTPVPSDIYRQMQLRQQAAGFKRKEGYWKIKICPSKEDWKALLGFEPVPGKLTDEQKVKVLEVANELIDASIEKLDATDHHGYRHNKKGEKYSCITGKHTNLADSQAVWSVHLDTDDIHIHGTANIVTEYNKVQETNKCIDRGFVAGDKVAEKFGLKQLSEYDNERKERIHADGIAVLQGMDKFDLNRYFGEMTSKGWIIDPNTPDRNGVVHGYSVGEKLYHNDGSLSSIIMFKSSELGHSKDLTPSHLLKTWQKLHAAEQQAEAPRETRRAEQPKQRTATVIPIEQEKPGRWSEEGRRKREEEQRKRGGGTIKNNNRNSLRPEAVESQIFLQKWIHSVFTGFDKDDQAAVMPGIIARFLDFGFENRSYENLMTAAEDFAKSVEGSAERIAAAIVECKGTVDIIGMFLPPVTASVGGGGGGSSTGGWGRRKDDDDDEWNYWKNGFKAMRARGKKR